MLGAGRQAPRRAEQSAARYPNIKPGQEFTGKSAQVAGDRWTLRDIACDLRIRRFLLLTAVEQQRPLRDFLQTVCGLGSLVSRVLRPCTAAVLLLARPDP